jgi:hypothetical protein
MASKKSSGCVGVAELRGHQTAPDGTTDVSVLQNVLKGRSSRIAMLYLNGYDLQKLPLIERKDCLGGC